MWEVGGLEGALEGGDGVVLGCDVGEGFRAAVEGKLAPIIKDSREEG